ncbi:hypothetical protein MUP46_03655 [Patescibacteria group bacterium]|nr:hypothetical protein [Patescibacteria group bacterium]
MKPVLGTIAGDFSYYTGIYVNEDGNVNPNCTWVWDCKTGEICDVTGTARVVVGYAKNRRELGKWLKEVK